MPLFQAIYSSGQNAIYGVRGPWVYKFNATTGAKEAEARFSSSCLGSEASIVEVGSFLYVTAWRGILEDPVNDANFQSDRDIYKINPTTLAATALGVWVNLSFDANSYQDGFKNLVTDGTNIYGLQGTQGDIFKVDPTSIGGYVNFGNGSNKDTIQDLIYDGNNLVLWFVDQRAISMNVIDNGYNITFDRAQSTPTLTKAVFGLARVPGTNKIYAVTGTQSVFKGNGNLALPKGSLSNFSWSLISPLDASAKPFRIKYRSSDGMLYVPTGSNNTVEILDPGTDTVTSIKTGFTSPIDVVFTSSKAFAVQDSAIGLREIT